MPQMSRTSYTISQLARHQKISLSIQRKAFQLIVKTIYIKFNLLTSCQCSMQGPTVPSLNEHSAVNDNSALVLNSAGSTYFQTEQ